MNPRLPAFERHHVVMRPLVVVVLQVAEHFPGGAEVERTDAGERLVALRWNSREVFLSARVQRPVVAWEGGASLEERRLSVDDRRVPTPNSVAARR